MKHKWRKNDYNGDDDVFAYESGYHNGPECETCGFFFCKHCDPDGWKTECGTAAIPGQAEKLDRAMVAMDAGIRGRVGLSRMRLDG